jgi:hypothetical protein
LKKQSPGKKAKLFFFYQPLVPQPTESFFAELLVDLLLEGAGVGCDVTAAGGGVF